MIENKMAEGLKAYREKLEAGEISVKNPIEKSFDNPRSLRYAINGKCFDCSAGSRKEIAECEITACTLHRFRPYQKKA